MADTMYLHEELMQEEGMSIRDLPIELQKQVKGFNVHKKKYEEKPNDKDKNRLVRLSTQLANNIQNFIEKQEDDEDEDDNEEDTVKKEVEKKQENKPTDTTGKADNKTDEVKQEEKLVSKKPITTGISFGNFVMEKKIKSICDANGGRIKITQLVSIINKQPDYPEQKVHNIKLRKVFLSSDYRIV